MLNNNLIILRHGLYNQGTGNLENGEGDRIGGQVAELLKKYNLLGSSFGILTSQEDRSIQTAEAIKEKNPGTSLLEARGCKQVFDCYPQDHNFKQDETKFGKQTEELLLQIRLRMETTKLGIILVGHEPSIFGLSIQLNLGLDKNQINNYEGLPLITTLN